MKKGFVWILILACLLAGCGGKTEEVIATQPVQTAPPTEPVTTQPVTEPQDPVDALLASMSLEEKVGQLFFARCPEGKGAEDAAQYHLGGYILFARDFASRSAEEVLADVQSYQAASQIPVLIGVDEEGGKVVRASSQFILRDTPFLSPQQLFAEGGMDRILADTKEKDDFLAAMGVNVNFAPVADISVDPQDFIYERTLGQDAKTTADYVSQVLAQMAEDNMGSSLKHFPGYGPNVDTHGAIAVDERPLETFQASDLLPFKTHAAGQGKTSIMVSHNIVNCLDDQMPASLSPKVHDFLRQELGFAGVVMPDALDMEAVAEYAQDGDIAVTALLAGNDMLLVCDYESGIPAILRAVTDGVIPESRIEEACRRVLTWKQALGLI